MLETRFVAADEGRWLGVAGDAYRILAGSAETDGAFAVFEALVPPGGGPPPHTHTREDESFFVLAGQLVFELETERRTAGPGTFLFAPRGRRHAFHNHTGEAARMLIQVSPGGFERFFERIGAAIDDPAAPPAATIEQLERLIATAAEFGVRIHTGGG